MPSFQVPVLGFAVCFLSPFMYDPEICTFEEDNVYNQADATGFINLFGLPLKVQAQVNEKNNK